MGTRVLILGGGGLLGRALLRHVPAHAEAVSPSRAELPLEDTDKIRARVEGEGIREVILTAAWTRVDDCETDPDRAFLINGHLPGRLAAALAPLGVPLTILSTDYVFDGSGRRPYREYDPAAPRGVYAQSKWYGECAVREAGGAYRIVRTSGLYGDGGPDFVTAIAARLARGPVSVVNDQTVAPTWVDDLAPAVWKIALSGVRGTIHAAASGETNWFLFARELARGLGYPEDRVQPTTTEAFGRPAPRPAYSILDTQRLRTELGIQLLGWREGLARRIAELQSA
jgi:dTDP-4-dehydrorhamnose reductase